MDFSFISQALSQLFAPDTAAFALATIGLAVHFGYTGLMNFGQSAFMAIGAYFFAIGSRTIGMPLPLCLLFGVVGAVVFALLLGIPTLRLRADYLSMVTIAAAEIVRYVAITPELTPLTGGQGGLTSFDYGNAWAALNPIPEPASGGFYILGPFSYSRDDLFNLIVCWAVVVIAALLVWGLMRSPWGRVVRGIREDEDAVRALGKNVFAYKMQALVLGGVIAGVAGMLYIMPKGLNPDIGGTQTTFFLWTILFLGGAATVFGPIVGSMIFWATLIITDGLVGLLTSADLLPISGIQGGQIRFILVGIGLMVLVIFRPQGIFGNKAETYFNG
ncbi:branched-chain amino acid ABC transporter permease [Acidipropionibacterium thoenii]|uniref:branched-chain amino acid ABC transporter permease n=1 Tax=Acidipropionibacterium thoenii TaxID=1751 RepID=UPI000400B5DD|nr:branched-chain amino acid ABC transporter permease [Acidipropionibacterium thoenii]